MTPVNQSAPLVAPYTAGDALVVAVLGAESTGKTWLAQALSAHLAHSTGLRCTWVPEWLRLWCEARGRTPARDEQLEIAQAQHDRIEQATLTHDIVVADTTALMTAVYSQHVFGDDSLRPAAWALHRRTHFSLLTSLDLPWVADGHQRDGPHVQRPIDELLQAWLDSEGTAYARVSGLGQARLTSAVRACQPVVEAWRGHRSSCGLA